MRCDRDRATKGPTAMREHDEYARIIDVALAR
jgi:hypothetical protein